MTDLRTAAQAQQQAEQTWVCPEAPEERTYQKPGHCENCGKTLVLAQPNPPGCDHCRHPLYAATRCRVCGRVTEQTEPPVDDPHRDHWVAIAEAAQKIAASTECGPAEAEALCAALDRLTAAALAQQAEPVEPVAWMFELARNFNLEGFGGWEKRITEYRPITPEGSVRNVTPLYTAPPQRKPLTEEEIDRIRADCVFTPHEYRDRACGWALHFARAIERAHGIKE